MADVQKAADRGGGAKRARRARASAPRPAAPRARRRDTGGKFQKAVFRALDELVPEHLARWDHYGEETRRVGAGALVAVGTAPPDVVAFTPAGHIYAAEVKHDARRIYVAAPPGDSHYARVEDCQREYLDCVAATPNGCAELILCVAGIVAVVPWSEVRTLAWIDRDTLASLAATHDDGAFSARVRHHMRLEGL